MNRSDTTILKNGALLDGGEAALPKGSGLAYEVIRILGGTPLFFREHHERLVRTGSLMGARPVPDLAGFRAMVDAFLATRTNQNYNIRILFEGATGDLYIQESPSAYPPPALYEEGIHTELMKYTRPDPNAKITNQELTELANRVKEATGAYEVLLVDESGRITEGSKSNLFFVTADTLCTPPLDAVLPGVTRGKIIETARLININVVETNINSEDLHRYEGAFMSGTSPKILPIRSIGALRFRSPELPLIRTLMAEFDRVIREDLADYRRGGLARA